MGCHNLPSLWLLHFWWGGQSGPNEVPGEANGGLYISLETDFGDSLWAPVVPLAQREPTQTLYGWQWGKHTWLHRGGGYSFCAVLTEP